MDKHGNAEVVLQAVIISDSYNTRFKPLTDDRPRCLMPLINVPLIEYTLEFLASSGVQEIFIFVCAHADQIKHYISHSSWQASGMPRIELITTSDSTSVGDAMRRLDEEQKIKSDFILLSGDIVSNLAGSDMVKAHKARRELDKSSIMTMVFRETNCSHRIRSTAESPVVVLSGSQNRCVHYSRAFQPQSAKQLLDLAVLKEGDSIQIRNDLVDCNIDICSPEVPALFSENFDYNDMRGDFVHGILTSDLLGKTIHSHVEDTKYAARVQDLRSYDAVSRDIIARWTYPIVPDNMAWICRAYTHERANVYTGESVRLSKKVIVSSHVVLGKHVKVGDNSKISFSTLGADCTIGPQCTIADSYLWENVIVGSNCRIGQALVANDVVIGAGCILHPGAILGPGVRLADGITIAANVRLVADGATDVEIVGQGGQGRVYLDARSESESSDSEDDEDGPNSFMADHANHLSQMQYRQATLNFSDLSISSLGSMPDSEWVRRPSFAASAQSEDENALIFYDLARADLETAFNEDHNVDDVMLEMTSLRMREDVGMHEVRIAVLSAILSKCEAGQSSKAVLRTKELVKRWGPLLQRTISPSTIKEDCLDLLLSMQKICSSTTASFDLFVPMTKFMYDDEILPEVAILDWYNDLQSASDESLRQTRQKAVGFVSWLQEAEEGSSDEYN